MSLQPAMVVHTLIPALGRQRQAGSEFEASLVCRASSRTARAIQGNPFLRRKKCEFLGVGDTKVDNESNDTKQ